MHIPWVDVFAVFVVCHLSGDFILQTEFQATNKHGGLGRDRVKRRALLQHTLSYTCAYLPAYLWLAGSASGAVLALTVVGIGLPHGLQDDGTAMRWWMLRVKRTQFAPGLLAMVVDQSFHMVALLLLAIAVGA